MNDRRAALGVFLAFLSLYLLTGRYLLDHSDGETMFESLESLLQGRLDIRSDLYPDNPDLFPGRDGRLYSPFGIGQPVLAMPLYLAGAAAARLLPRLPAQFVTRAAVMLFVPLVTALTCAVVFLIARSLGYGAACALGGVVVYGVGTLAWPYTKTFFSDPLGALLLLLTIWYVYRAREKTSVRAAIAGGAFAAAGILVRHQALLVAGIGAALVATATYPAALSEGEGVVSGKRRGSTRRLALVSGYVAPVLVATAIWAWLNWAKFGAPLTMTSDLKQSIGGTPLWRGIALLLVSPGKGLLWYSPAVLLGAVGLRALWRSHRDFVWVLLAMIVPLACLYASLTTPGGHWCWGPRFLVATLPALGVAMAAALSRWQEWSKGLRAAVVALIGVSVAIQMLMCAVNFMHVYRVIDDTGAPPQYHEFEVRYSPLLVAAQELPRLEWSPMLLAALKSGSPSKDLRRSIRATLDCWPAYVYRLGMPRALLILFPLQLLLTALLFRKCVSIVRLGDG